MTFIKKKNFKWPFIPESWEMDQPLWFLSLSASTWPKFPRVQPTNIEVISSQFKFLMWRHVRLFTYPQLCVDLPQFVETVLWICSFEGELFILCGIFHAKGLGLGLALGLVVMVNPNPNPHWYLSQVDNTHNQMFIPPLFLSPSQHVEGATKHQF